MLTMAFYFDSGKLQLYGISEEDDAVRLCGQWRKKPDSG